MTSISALARPIAKAPQRDHRRAVGTHPSARAAIAEFLRDVVRPSVYVCLPAYVGWSPREGSGLRDALTAAGCEPSYYRVDERLNVDLPALRMLLDQGPPPRALIVVHYFGRPDPHYEDIVALANDLGIPVLEDCAHALFSDLIGGICGRRGDAAVLSLHKQLPQETGGHLLRGDGAREALMSALPFDETELRMMAQARQRNAAIIRRSLAEVGDLVQPLWDEPSAGVVPQTFPVLIRSDGRDRLYEDLNRLGFGVVSLYHTLVDDLPAHDFPDSHRLAAHIMNLPVHHEIDPEQLDAGLKLFRRLVRGDSR